MFRREFLKLGSVLPLAGLIPTKKEEKEITSVDIDYYLNQGRINFHRDDISSIGCGFNGVCEIDYDSRIKISIKGKHNILSYIVEGDNSYKNKDGGFLIGIERIEKSGLNEWCDCFMLFKMLECEYLIKEQSFDFSGRIMGSYNGLHIRCPMGQLPERFSCQRKKEIVTEFYQNCQRYSAFFIKRGV